MVKRARTQRREDEREAQKLVRARVRLALLEVGGAAERPIEVESASVVEPHAASLPCPACGASGVRVEEHVARALPEGGGLIRIAKTVCQRCGTRREIFFRIRQNLPS